MMQIKKGKVSLEKVGEGDNPLTDFDGRGFHDR